jgi:hypothetical protein
MRTKVKKIKIRKTRRNRKTKGGFGLFSMLTGSKPETPQDKNDEIIAIKGKIIKIQEKINKIDINTFPLDKLKQINTKTSEIEKLIPEVSTIPTTGVQTNIKIINP